MTIRANFFLLLFACMMPYGCDEYRSIKNERELFTLDIECKQTIPSEKKVNMVLHYKRNEENLATYSGKIERRGARSITFRKRSYEIDLNKDLSLAGLPKDDDWILNANYIDKTFLRHVLSYELFREMSPQNVAPKCQFIELALNGEYNGLYVLMEKMDKSSLGINGKDTTAVVFKDPHLFRDNYEGICPWDMSDFHQQTYPKNKNKSAFVEEVRRFILTSSDQDFTEHLPTVFDIENLIDWHLLLLMSNNGDGVLKNFFIYKKDKNTPIRIAPWDYDHSFGRDGDNELNLDKIPVVINRSVLFRRLMQFDWYKIRLKQKWQKLNKSDILSEEGLKERIIINSDAIRDLANKNFERWSVDSDWYYDANGFDEEIDIMLKFVTLRHRRLKEYFDFGISGL